MSSNSNAVATPSRGRNLLFIGGLPDEAEMYGEWLRMLGYTVTLTTSAADGYRLAATLPPSVIVTEIRLNGSEDGLSLTRRLKRDERLRHVPVVVLTGLATDGYRAAAECAGCDLFICKPCLPDDLIARLAPFL